MGAGRLLRDNPAFRTLCTARVVSFAGDSLSLVALMIHVVDTAGQAVAVSLLLLAGDFVPSLVSPVSGAISDRFDLKRVMVTCEVVQGVLIVAIAVALPPLPLLLALVAVRAVAGQIFGPASRSAVPALVDDRDLAPANSALGFGTNAGEAVGPLLAAALFPLLGVRGVLLVDAATFLVSAVLLSTLRPIPPTEHGAGRPSLVSQARSGWAYIWSTRAIRLVLLGFGGVVAFTAVDDVALVVLAKDTFEAGDSAVALLLGAVGLGLLAGFALLARSRIRLGMAALLLAGFAVSSVGNLLTGLAWAVAVAFALQAVRGVGIAAIEVASNTLLQRLVPRDMLGRVFGNLYGVIGVAAAVSYVSGGLLLDATSAPLTFLVAGAGGTVVTVLVALRLPAAVRAHVRDAGRLPDPDRQDDE
ncbi:MAG: MFS transporter [Propionibacteriales bacterium]|nr:MFS transporter [Propionibacteriales bacterium]